MLAIERNSWSAFVKRMGAVGGDDRMRTLDNLRGLAVLLVLFSHLAIGAFPEFAAWESKNLNFGTAGVLIFFCVSGYVITWSIGDATKQHGPMAAGIFIIRRAFRLLPPYIVLAALTWFFATPYGLKEQILASIHASPAGYWLRMITLTSFFGGDPSVFRGAEWTLAYEATFYAACALFLFTYTHTRKLPIIYVIIFLLSVVTLMPNEITESKAQNFSFMLLFFACGTLVYVYRNGDLSKREYIALILACAGTIIARVSIVSFTYHRLYSETIASLIALAVFFAVISIPFRLPRWLATMGLVSYSLYLVHGAVPTILPLEFLPALVRPIFWLAISISLAGISYLVVERPAIRAGKRVIGRLQQARSLSNPKLIG